MKSNWKVLALMALLSSVVTLAAYNLLGFNKRDVIFNESAPAPTITGRLAALTGNGPSVPGDFSSAAELVTPTRGRSTASAAGSGIRVRGNY